MNHPAQKSLPWRIEETCLKGWPALEEEQTGGWLLRYSNGLTRRANSANPLNAETGDIDALIAACEARYHAHGLPAIFRVPSIIEPAMQERLDKLGYGPEGHSVVLHAHIGYETPQPYEGIELASRISPEWLAAMSRVQKHSEQNSATYAQLVSAIAVPAAFAMVRTEGQVVSLAYGAIHDGLLCFESVITDAPFRGRGYASRMLGSLVAWGKSAGANEMCLQVEADNEPAKALYNGLGFRELYRYHYRREPASG